MIEMAISADPRWPWFRVGGYIDENGDHFGGELINAKEMVCTCREDTFRQGGKDQINCEHLRAFHHWWVSLTVNQRSVLKMTNQPGSIVECVIKKSTKNTDLNPFHGKIIPGGLVVLFDVNDPKRSELAENDTVKARIRRDMNTYLLANIIEITKKSS